MRKIKSMLAALFIGTFLGGCANEASDEDTVTLSMWNRYPGMHQFLEDFVDGFEEEHPEIEINLDRIPEEDSEAAYQTAASEGNFPDIFTHGVIPLYEYVELDLVKNLDELFPEEVRDQYHPGTWVDNEHTYNDEVYVLPIHSPNHITFMLYYNEEVLEEYGISEDEIPQTWEELIEVGNHIYENSDGHVYGLMHYNSWKGAPFVEQQATAISPESPSNMNFIEGEPDYDHQGNIETIEFLRTLLEENVMHPASQDIQEHEAEAHFAAGNVAFYMGANWAGSHLITDDFENWGVAEMPTKDGNPYYNTGGGEPNGLMVSEDTDHWEEVKVFLEYAQEYYEQEIVIPEGASQPARDDLEFEAPYPQYEDIYELMTEQTFTVPDTTERDLATIDFDIDLDNRTADHDMEQIINGYLVGEIDDVESALREADEAANEAFDDLLEEHEEVDRELYQFPNWEPFTPYTEEDYEELDD